jgi:crotonobetainyl-CoA:carnitine CoA-transferase CaiB-like acyl-CoA transferase
MRRELPETSIGSVAVTANPVRMSGHDTTAPIAPPRLGVDTNAVLTDNLGLTAEQLACLAERGIIDRR